MNCFVTGATGFIGRALVLELAARGHRVKALARPGWGEDGIWKKGGEAGRLEDACEVVPGNILDGKELETNMRGCDWCFHVAGSYHLWLKDYQPMYATNVHGTRTVLEAARRAGCSRIVYTSTVGCIGLLASRDGRVQPSDETVLAPESQMTSHYKRSKWMAEAIARRMAADGLPVVIVNPSAPIGPGDRRPTPTGKMIVDCLNGKMPAFVETGLNWVAVRDVAIGHILAAEKGRVGERYILGNAEGNWTMKQTCQAIGELAGGPVPTIQIPYFVALVAGYLSEGVSKLTGQPPRVPLGGVRMARHTMFFNPAKAIRELGLPQTPPRQALAEAIEWFRSNGYVRPGA